MTAHQASASYITSQALLGICQAYSKGSLQLPLHIRSAPRQTFCRLHCWILAPLCSTQLWLAAQVLMHLAPVWPKHTQAAHQMRLQQLRSRLVHAHGTSCSRQQGRQEQPSLPLSCQTALLRAIQPQRLPHWCCPRLRACKGLTLQMVLQHQQDRPFLLVRQWTPSAASHLSATQGQCSTAQGILTGPSSMQMQTAAAADAGRRPQRLQA